MVIGLFRQKVLLRTQPIIWISFATVGLRGSMGLIHLPFLQVAVAASEYLHNIQGSRAHSVRTADLGEPFPLQRWTWELGGLGVHQAAPDRHWSGEDSEPWLLPWCPCRFSCVFSLYSFFCFSFFEKGGWIVVLFPPLTPALVFFICVMQLNIHALFIFIVGTSIKGYSGRFWKK